MANPITMVPTVNGMRPANVDANGNVITTKVPGGVSQAADGSLMVGSKGLGGKKKGGGVSILGGVSNKRYGDASLTGGNYPSMGQLYPLATFKKGGKVKKTGPALVHKGEVVLNKKQQKKVGMKKVQQAIKKTYKNY